MMVSATNHNASITGAAPAQHEHARAPPPLPLSRCLRLSSAANCRRPMSSSSASAAAASANRFSIAQALRLAINVHKLVRVSLSPSAQAQQPCVIILSLPPRCHHTCFLVHACVRAPLEVASSVCCSRSGCLHSNVDGKGYWRLVGVERGMEGKEAAVSVHVTVSIVIRHEHSM